MALSGTIYKNVGAHWRLQLEWTGTQSISGNYTDVTAKLYWMALDGYGAVNSSATKDCAIYIDGTWDTYSAAGLASLSGNQKKLIHSFTKRVYHNADGTGSVTLDAYFDAEVTLGGTYYGRIELDAKTFTLDTIPRASSLTSSASWTAGNDLGISISRASTSFTHTVKIYVNNVLIKTLTNVGSSATADFTTAENTSIFNQLNTAASTSSKIELLTYNGSTLIGTKTYTGTVTAPAASTISSSVSFNIGDSVTFSISRANSGFTHTLEIYIGGTLIKTITGVGTSTTWTPTSSEKTAMYNTTPNSNTVGVEVRCTTYYNGEQVRTYTSKTGTATVTNSNPIFSASSVTYADTNTTTTT